MSAGRGGADAPIQDTQTTGSAWAATAAVLLVYVVYVLLIVFAPGLMAAPLSDGSYMNFGIVVGALIIVFCFVLGFAYTVSRNRRDLTP